MGKKAARVKGLLAYKLLEFMRGRYSWEQGATLSEIARAVYGSDDPLARQRARSLISRVRREYLAPLKIALYSLPGNGPDQKERRYFILAKPEDYEKAMKRFSDMIKAFDETRSKLNDLKQEIEVATDEWIKTIDEMTTLILMNRNEDAAKALINYLNKADALIKQKKKEILKQYPTITSASETTTPTSTASTEQPTEQKQATPVETTEPGKKSEKREVIMVGGA